MALGEDSDEGTESGPYILWRVCSEICSVWNIEPTSFRLVHLLLKRKPHNTIWIKVEMFLNTIKYAILANASTLVFYNKI